MPTRRAQDGLPPLVSTPCVSTALDRFSMMACSGGPGGQERNILSFISIKYVQFTRMENAPI